MISPNKIAQIYQKLHRLTNTPTHDHWSNQTDAGHGLNIHLYDYVNP